MTVERVFKAVQDYLGDESTVFECALDPASRARVREELERARGHLRKEIAAFEAHRAARRLFGRILVAVDGSDQAGWAADVAGRVAGGTGGRGTPGPAGAAPAPLRAHH